MTSLRHCRGCDRCLSTQCSRTLLLCRRSPHLALEVYLSDMMLSPLCFQTPGSFRPFSSLCKLTKFVPIPPRTFLFSNFTLLAHWKITLFSLGAKERGGVGIERAEINWLTVGLAYMDSGVMLTCSVFLQEIRCIQSFQSGS